MVAHCDTQREPPSSPHAPTSDPARPWHAGHSLLLHKRVTSVLMGTWDPEESCGGRLGPHAPLKGQPRHLWSVGNRVGCSWPADSAHTAPRASPSRVHGLLQGHATEATSPLPRGQFWGLHPCWGLGAGVTTALACVPTLVPHPCKRHSPVGCRRLCPVHALRALPFWTQVSLKRPLSWWEPSFLPIGPSRADRLLLHLSVPREGPTLPPKCLRSRLALAAQTLTPVLPRWPHCMEAACSRGTQLGLAVLCPALVGGLSSASGRTSTVTTPCGRGPGCSSDMDI